VKVDSGTAYGAMEQRVIDPTIVRKVPRRGRVPQLVRASKFSATRFLGYALSAHRHGLLAGS
jgi:hypothetical protein